MDFLKDLIEQVDTGTGLPNSFWILSIEFALFLVLVFFVFRFVKGPSKTFQDGVMQKLQVITRIAFSAVYVIKSTIDNVFRSQEWKYEKPWYLLVGSDSAKELFVASCLSSRLAVNKDTSVKDVTFTEGRILGLNKGMIIVKNSGSTAVDSDERQDADATLSDGGSEGPRIDNESTSYRALVKEIVQVRPQRALDGIVLVVAAEELLLDGEKDSDRFSIRLADRVRLVQRLVEFTLPVYIVISETHKIEFFDDFWKAQPRELDKQQAFGWASPHCPDTLFKASHFEEALAGIAERLNAIQLQTELSSSVPNEVDGFLRFPRKLFKCNNPLRRLGLQVFNTGARSKNLQFRGVYYCGRLPSDDETEKHDSKGRTAAFVDKLFNEVVFGAGMQAEPTRRRILSRNVYLFRFQVAMIAAAIFMFGSLYFSNRHLDHQIESISKVVKSVRSWNTSDLASCVELNSSNEVYSLLSNMATLDGRPTYWNIPLSWIENVSELTETELVNSGMNKIVLPNVECHLQAQAKKLSIVTASVTGGGAEWAAGDLNRMALGISEGRLLEQKMHADELDRYIKNVIEFERNYHDFTSIAPKKHKDSGPNNPMSVLVRLLEAVYREDAPKILREKEGQHSKSLVYQDYPIKWLEVYTLSGEGGNYSNYCLSNAELAKYNQRQPISISLIASNICVLAERIYNDIVDGTSIVDAGSISIDEELNNLIVTSPQFAFTLVKEWGALASKFEVVNGVEFNTPCRRFRLHMQQISYSLSEAYSEESLKLLAPAIELFSELGGCESRAKANIETVKQALSNVDSSGGGAATFAIDRFIETADQKKYFKHTSKLSTKGSLECKNGINRWDIGALSQAEAFIREYHDLVEENSWQDVAVGDSPLKRLALNQLEFSLNQVLYASQQYDSLAALELDVLSAVSVKESELASVGVNFNRAVNHIIPITKNLSALQLNGLGVALTKCSRNYAKNIVNAVQNFTTPLGLYRELPQVSQNLPLNSDFSFTLYNKADLDDYLDSEQKRMRIVLSYLESALVLLGETQHVESHAWQAERPTIAFWRNTLTDFSSYQRELSNTQLGELNALYKRLASDEDLCENLNSLPIGGFGYDFFAKRRSQLVVSLSQLCQTQLAEAVGQNYLFVYNEFNQRFENRYPFTLNRNSTEQASAVEFRNFLLANGGAIDNLLKQTEVLGATGKRWRDIHTFLIQIAELKRIFSSSLAHEPQSRPLYLATHFDTPKDTNLVSSQATTWELATQRYSITNTEFIEAGDDKTLSPQLIWRFGDDLTISINWSNSSPYVVVNDSDAGGQLTQYSKTFTQKITGDWSLLKLFDLYQSEVSTDSLLFNVPLQISPELQGKTAYKNLGAHPISVPLHLSVQPFSQNAQGVLEAFELPSQFPVFAPPLPGDSYVYH